MPGAAKKIGALVVGEKKDDIGALCGIYRGGDQPQPGDEKKRWEKWFHVFGKPDGLELRLLPVAKVDVAVVLPDGSLLTGYSVHFPAPFHPTGMRESAYRRLNELRAGLPADRSVFAAGDFNTTAVEDRDKAKLDRWVRPYWTVAHDVGCDDCPGTSYYARRDDWSFLDMILWSPGTGSSEETTWNLRADSVQMANRGPGQTRPDGTPWRFEMPAGSGVSDHWPMVAGIEIE